MRRVATLVASMMLVLSFGQAGDAVAQSDQVTVSVTLVNSTTTPGPTPTTGPNAAPTLVPTETPVATATKAPVTQLPVTGSGSPGGTIFVPAPFVMLLLAGSVIVITTGTASRKSENQ